jgi:cell division protein FtsI (penicillin-binding protein 3)
MGIGKPTGIDLPSESIGQLKSEAQFVNVGVESATAAFGQGLSMTPLQLAQLLAVIGNGGNLVVPHVVVGLVDVQGNIRWQPKYPAPRRIFSSHTTNTVLQMMTAVVNQGTGKASQIPGYSIAGKTGTAQKANSKGGYGNRTISSFGAILPANAPRFVVLTVIDEPMGDNAFGSTVSAPVVKAVMEVLIGLDGIPPQGLFTH